MPAAGRCKVHLEGASRAMPLTTVSFIGMNYALQKCAEVSIRYCSQCVAHLNCFKLEQNNCFLCFAVNCIPLSSGVPFSANL